MVLSPQELASRLAVSAHLASATVKMARAALGGSDASLIVPGLSPLEAHYAQTQGDRLEKLITTRVDFFIGKTVAALEVNATIPAMQAYSDIAAHTFIETVGGKAGLPARDIERLKVQNGSNALALLAALKTAYAAHRDGRVPERIALLSRRNDAQVTEQRSLAATWTAAGIESVVVHPDELEVTASDVCVGGKKFDLIYRHLFVRRLEEPQTRGAETVKALLETPISKRAVIVNAPASQVEAKATFALLSEATVDAALAQRASLSTVELSTIAAHVPWTRVFRGEALIASVGADPDRYVLKRSWDYGGRAVFVGKSRDDASYSERVVKAFGRAMPWPELCRAAAADTRGGGFVVQEFVESKPVDHWLCSDDGLSRKSLYVDFSAYASVGYDAPAWGGVCRGSVSPIVNIVGGGGVVPLLIEPVAAALADGLRRVK